MPKVLISDKMSPRAAEIFEQRGLDVDVKPGLSPEELKQIIGKYDGLAVRSATKVTSDILEAADHLKVIGRAGIGVDNIDVPGATQRGVVVMNTPFGNSITTAEHAIAMMFSLARQVPQANQSTHEGKWEKSRFMGVELTGKVLGVVGCGNIGSIVASRGIGLHMRVIAFDPFLTEDRARDLGVEKVSLDDLLARSDFISMHTPLTSQTKHLIDKVALAKTRKGVRIINCARGGLIVEEDLAEAIDSGQVAGAALDVFEQEPAKENVLFGKEQVVCTPHLGASTSEAQENVAIQVAEQMADFLLNGAVENALNMPSVSAEDAPRLKPYMKLVEQLGGFAGQLTESSIKEVEIEYQGHVSGLNTKPLSGLILMGLLTPLLDTVNMVNAPIIAKERGIRVSEKRTEQGGDYQSLVRLTVKTEKRDRSVAGTLFAGSKPRIVEIENVGIEAEVTPNMLYVRNQDLPGFIGNLGRVLGDSNINIASFHLGRSEQGKDAIALVSVDERVGEPVLRKIRALPSVVQVKVLDF